MPFPFLLASVFLSLLILGSYFKEREFTKVITCLAGLIACFELPMYALIVGFALSEGLYLVMVLAMVGLVFLIAANVSFAFRYRKTLVNGDPTFEKWLTFFQRTRTLMPLVLTTLNFKCV